MVNSSYQMGYYYDMAKRGTGWAINATTGLGDRMCISGCTKKSANKLKREFKADGFTDISIDKAKAEFTWGSARGGW